MHFGGGAVTNQNGLGIGCFSVLSRVFRNVGRAQQQAATMLAFAILRESYISLARVLHPVKIYHLRSMVKSFITLITFCAAATAAAAAIAVTYDDEVWDDEGNNYNGD